MAKMLSRVAPWLTSASRLRTDSGCEAAVALGHAEIRALDDGDTPRLWELVKQDPVSNVFLAAHLESTKTAAPTPSGAEILGYFADGALAGACWSGVNLVPTALTAELVERIRLAWQRGTHRRSVSSRCRRPCGHRRRRTGGRPPHLRRR